MPNIWNWIVEQFEISTTFVKKLHHLRLNQWSILIALSNQTTNSTETTISIRLHIYSIFNIIIQKYKKLWQMCLKDIVDEWIMRSFRMIYRDDWLFFIIVRHQDAPNTKDHNVHYPISPFLLFLTIFWT